MRFEYCDEKLCFCWRHKILLLWKCVVETCVRKGTGSQLSILSLSIIIFTKLHLYLFVKIDFSVQRMQRFGWAYSQWRRKVCCSTALSDERDRTTWRLVSICKQQYVKCVVYWFTIVLSENLLLNYHRISLSTNNRRWHYSDDFRLNFMNRWLPHLNYCTGRTMWMNWPDFTTGIEKHRTESSRNEFLFCVGMHCSTTKNDFHWKRTSNSCSA